MAHTLEAAGIEDRPKAGLADAGYWSEANIRACSWPGMPELLIATTKDWKQRKMLREKGCPRGRIPKGLSPWDRMERKLLTKRGRALARLDKVRILVGRTDRQVLEELGTNPRLVLEKRAKLRPGTEAIFRVPRGRAFTISPEELQLPHLQVRSMPRPLSRAWLPCWECWPYCPRPSHQPRSSSPFLSRYGQAAATASRGPGHNANGRPA